jgi:hypothetical protein
VAVVSLDDAVGLVRGARPRALGRRLARPSSALSRSTTLRASCRGSLAAPRPGQRRGGRMRCAFSERSDRSRCAQR